MTEAENVLILQVTAEENRQWQGRTLAEIAAERGADPIDTALDLIASDRSRVGVAFFSMSEENLREALRRPWVAHEFRRRLDGAGGRVSRARRLIPGPTAASPGFSATTRGTRRC